MNRQAEITGKDMKLLCAYLDNALSVKDRAKFEKRLQQSPELKQALADMTALKHNMRSLPVRKVPYQFTLTRSEAEKARRGRFLLPTFGWASAVSMILLAVIFGSEFIFANFSAPQPASEPLAMTLQNDAVPESALREAKDEGSEPVYLLNWTSLGGKGGVGGGDVAYGMGGGGFGMGGGGVMGDESAAGIEGESAEPYSEEAIMAEPLQAEEPAEPSEEANTLTGEKIMVEPLIFGVREDQLGEVIGVEPEETPVLTFAEAPEDVEVRQELHIPTNLKWILAGLAVTFGLIWLFIRFRK